MAIKILNPELFQGNLSKKNYFEGWYFKHVSKDLSQVYSFIPGVSLSKTDPHAFIQVFDGITGKTDYIRYDLDEFITNPEKLDVKIGSSEFSINGIKLNINSIGMSIIGEIDFKDMVNYPKTFLSPGIMGLYSFVPFMECKHGVVSISHNLYGILNINNKKFDFTGGKGYIEKDWGSSFPKSWIWTQCNTFSKSDASLHISIANIPWLGSYFVGFISFLYINGNFHLFSTYNRSKIKKVNYDGNILSITLENDRHIMDVKIIKSKSSDLIAPVQGSMTRRIKESIDSEVIVKLYDKANNLIFEDNGKRAGLEIIDSIFEDLAKVS